jgi:hypothetical protein
MHLFVSAQHCRVPSLSKVRSPPVSISVRVSDYTHHVRLGGGMLAIVPEEDLNNVSCVWGAI